MIFPGIPVRMGRGRFTGAFAVFVITSGARMTLSPSVDVSRRPLVTRLVVSLVAALSLVLGPLAFTPAQAVTSFTVSGTVTGEGLPIGSSVELQKWNSQDEYYIGQQSADSDEEDGTYEFTDVDPGKYRVHVESSGFAPRNSASFTVKSLSVKVPVVNLETGGSIGGRVVDAKSGDPIPDASVQVFPVVGQGIDGDGSVYASMAEDGSFVAEDLAPGSYKVQIRDDNGNHVSEYYDNAVDVATAKPVNVTKGGGADLGTIGLATGAKMHGVVQDDAGSAIPDRQVYALRVLKDGSSDYSNAYDATTDESGAYLFQGLPTGSYKVQLAGDYEEYFAQFYNNRPSDETADPVGVVLGDDIDLGTSTLERKSEITGLVRDAADKTIDDILVDAYRVRDGVVDTEPTDYAYSGAFDGPGEFTLRDLHAGTYRLVVKDGERIYRGKTLEDVSVGPGETISIGDIVLTKAPKVAASVKVSATGGKKKATFTIQVKASGFDPTGKVTVKLGSKTLKSATLKDSRAKITVTGQKKGKRSYTVVYSGDKHVLARTVTTGKVTIK